MHGALLTTPSLFVPPAGSLSTGYQVWDGLLVAARLVLAAVFLVAAIAKLADLLSHFPNRGPGLHEFARQGEHGPEDGAPLVETRARDR